MAVRLYKKETTTPGKPKINFFDKTLKFHIYRKSWFNLKLLRSPSYLFQFPSKLLSTTLYKNTTTTPNTLKAITLMTLFPSKYHAIINDHKCLAITPNFRRKQGLGPITFVFIA
jgi:hypothetical protein